MDKWIIKENKNIFEGKIYDIHDLYCEHPQKKINHHFHIIETFNWINIVAVSSDNKIIMVKQHRLGTDELTIETPAGVIEEGEEPVNAAARELLEETGFSTGNIVLLKKLAANPAIMNNYIYIYLATECDLVSGQNLDMSEDIEVCLYSRDEIMRMIDGGIISHSIAVTPLSLYFLSLKNMM